MSSTHSLFPHQRGVLLLRHLQGSLHNRDYITMEGFVDTIKNAIPSIVSAFNDFCSQFSKDEIKLKNISTKERAIILEITSNREIDYIDLKQNVSAYIPQHYTGTYLSYSILLKEMCGYVATITDNLRVFNQDVGILSSTEEGKLNDYSAYIAKYNTWSTNKTHLKKQIAASFTASSPDSIAPYGQVIRRNAEWDELLQNLDDAVKLINGVSVKELSKLTYSITASLKEVKKSCERGEYIKADVKLPEALAVGALEIAEELEFYSLTCYQLQTLVGCISKTVVEMKTFADICKEK